jgi:fructose-specific component phosphotransferase system IIB-like protein
MKTKHILAIMLSFCIGFTAGTAYIYPYKGGNDMATITPIAAGQTGATIITTINTNFTNVNGEVVANTSALGDKQNTITGAASTITGTNLTINRALISNASGKVAISTATSTELGYLSGVTSAIQTQINTKQNIAYGGAYRTNTTLVAVVGSDTNFAKIALSATPTILSGVTYVADGQLRVASTGVYRVSGNLSFGGADEITVCIFVNSTAREEGRVHAIKSSITNNPVSIETIISLSANDVIALGVTNRTASTPNVAVSCYSLMVQRLN